MGHTCQVLTFDAAKYTKQQIQDRCDEWGNYNADLEERGGCLCGLGSPIQFTNLVFDSRDEADAYLDKTFGRYNQTAVRYKQYPPVKPSADIADLNRRIGEYDQRIAKLNAPHYRGAKQATVKCKKCGSSLATAYCGTTWHNNCPVCREEMRPQSTLDKIDSYKHTVITLKDKRDKLVKERDRKRKEQPVLFWAVACEVHS